MLVCTNSKQSLALYSLVVKALLVILPFIQDLLTRRSSGIKEGNILDLTNLWIQFKLI